MPARVSSPSHVSTRLAVPAIPFGRVELRFAEVRDDFGRPGYIFVFDAVGGHVVHGLEVGADDEGQVGEGGRLWSELARFFNGGEGCKDHVADELDN
jgi:hypothetical protein